MTPFLRTALWHKIKPILSDRRDQFLFSDFREIASAKRMLIKEAKIGDKRQINVIEFKLLHARPVDPSKGGTIS
jgi:hypothetical protein